MRVPQDAPLEEVGVDLDEAFGIERAPHIINVGFASTVESCKITPSE